MIKFDGQYYENESDVPEFSSIRLVNEKGNIRDYEGLIADVSKLPTYVLTGSSFFALDTGAVYKFDESTKTWLEI